MGSANIGTDGCPADRSGTSSQLCGDPAARQDAVVHADYSDGAYWQVVQVTVRLPKHVVTSRAWLGPEHHRCEAVLPEYHWCSDCVIAVLLLLEYRDALHLVPVGICTGGSNRHRFSIPRYHSFGCPDHLAASFHCGLYAGIADTFKRDSVGSKRTTAFVRNILAVIFARVPGRGRFTLGVRSLCRRGEPVGSSVVFDSDRLRRCTGM